MDNFVRIGHALLDLNQILSVTLSKDKKRITIDVEFKNSQGGIDVRAPAGSNAMLMLEQEFNALSEKLCQ